MSVFRESSVARMVWVLIRFVLKRFVARESCVAFFISDVK